MLVKINLFESGIIDLEPTLAVRLFALGVLGCRFAPWPLHTKGDTNGTGSSLADTGNKG